MGGWELVWEDAFERWAEADHPDADLRFIVLEWLQNFLDGPGFAAAAPGLRSDWFAAQVTDVPVYVTYVQKLTTGHGPAIFLYKIETRRPGDD